jgi:Tol biopolymer transport system component
MPVDSGPARLIVDSTGPQGIVSDQPLWSPDGRAILTRNSNERGEVNLWFVPVDGGSQRLLLTFNGPGPRPARGGWGIRGNRIVYTAPAQQSDIWVMEVNTP